MPSSSDMPVGVALVGFGYAGQTFHAPLIATCAGLRLHAIVSRGQAARDFWPDARVATDLDQALADPAVELVVVATPNDTHAPLALRSLEAGKAVVVDKPFALSTTEAREMIAMSDRVGRLLSVFHNRRWDADFLAVRQLLAEGRLGRITRMESHFDRFRPQVRDRWREQAGLGGGLWFDLGPHLIDQALVLFGRPDAVIADLTIQRAGGQAVDYAHVILRYDALRVILHADALSAVQPFRFVVAGDRGAYQVGGLDTQEDALKRGDRPGGPDWGRPAAPGLVVEGEGEPRAFVGPVGDYPAYYAAVARAVRGQGPNPVPGHEALAVMEVLEAAERSNRLRAEVAL